MPPAIPPVDVKVEGSGVSVSSTEEYIEKGAGPFPLWMWGVGGSGFLYLKSQKYIRMYIETATDDSLGPGSYKTI